MKHFHSNTDKSDQVIRLIDADSGLTVIIRKTNEPVIYMDETILNEAKGLIQKGREARQLDILSSHISF